ncbi:hypothetical protein [Hyphococcus aureus]|uniref:Uncharacterized protein n=1 Tax=Hyphococcus aureus TaxID=2666033 RepID=A0ABW1KUT5_9PROT
MKLITRPESMATPMAPMLNISRIQRKHLSSATRRPLLIAATANSVIFMQFIN